MEQGSLEWKLERCGCATASRFKDVISRSKESFKVMKEGRQSVVRAFESNQDAASFISTAKVPALHRIEHTKGESLAARKTYLIEVLTEQLTGEPILKPTTPAMEWGTENESYARTAYEISTGNTVEEVGFVRISEYCGASPDGLIGSDGGVEFKCPYNSVNHINTIIEGSIPPWHIAQVQGCMWATQRDWWDFVSFDPRMPKNLQLFSQRILRNDSYIKLMTSSVVDFLADVNDIKEKLVAR